MTDTDIDDLFAGDDEPKAKPKRARKPRAKSEPPAGTPVSAEDAANAARPRNPNAGSPSPAEPIDNAVNIRRLDWECVCGNTNTLDLQRCGKCNAHRYTD